MVFLVAALVLIIALLSGAVIAPTSSNHGSSGSPLRALETEGLGRRVGSRSGDAPNEAPPRRYNADSKTASARNNVGACQFFPGSTLDGQVVPGWTPDGQLYVGRGGLAFRRSDPSWDHRWGSGAPLQSEALFPGCD
jgi:hypothetical protein